MGENYVVTQVLKEAILSDDGKYRYFLSRRWGAGSQVSFLMLNPSTADASNEDPTLLKCIRFAKGWGYEALSIVNLYAYRTAHPAELWQTPDPVGPDNNEFLEQAAASNELIVAAWGVNAKQQRVQEVLSILGLERLHYLRLSKNGQPCHP